MQDSNQRVPAGGDALEEAAKICDRRQIRADSEKLPALRHGAYYCATAIRHGAQEVTRIWY